MHPASVKSDWFSGLQPCCSFLLLWTRFRSPVWEGRLPGGLGLYSLPIKAEKITYWPGDPAAEACCRCPVMHRELLVLPRRSKSSLVCFSSHASPPDFWKYCSLEPWLKTFTHSHLFKVCVLAQDCAKTSSQPSTLHQPITSGEQMMSVFYLAQLNCGKKLTYSNNFAGLSSPTKL